MDFVFTGFAQANAVRQFAFECVADDRSRTSVTVQADLTLARKYNISLQELPLLCRRLLETSQDGVLPASMTLTEDKMASIRSAVLNAAADRKPARRPMPSKHIGHAWRGQQQ